MDTPFVRQYSEDRELSAWLLLDRSPSMGFGPIDRPKELVLAELATTIARLLTRTGNRVGAMLFDNGIERTLPPRSSRDQVLALARVLLEPARPDRAVTDLSGALEAALGVVRRRSLVVVISDFITAPGWERPLLQLAERNEVVAIRLVDPREYELPDAGVIVVEDAETGEQLTVDSSDAEFRHRLREAGEAREAELRGDDASSRRRHLRGLDAGRARPGARPHRRIAKAAAAMISFQSPWLLLGLAVVPVVVGSTGGRPRRRAGSVAARGRGARPDRVRRSGFGSDVTSRSACSSPRSRSRARARPSDGEPALPGREGTVILAIDVSNSMGAKDVKPSGSRPRKPPPAPSSSDSRRPSRSASSRSGAAR